MYKDPQKAGHNTQHFRLISSLISTIGLTPDKDVDTMGLNVSTEARSLEVLFCRLLPPIVLGMFLGFAMINHNPPLPSTFHQGNFVVWAMTFAHFLWFFFVWGIVYIGGLYLLLLRPILRGVINRGVRYSGTLPYEILLEVILGIWICGQITGSWVEGEDSSCFRKGTCQYSAIAEAIWNPHSFTKAEADGSALFFAPRLLYTFIGTVGAVLLSSLICDNQCIFIVFLLFCL